jgi:hypothetical protein
MQNTKVSTLHSFDEIEISNMNTWIFGSEWQQTQTVFRRKPFGRHSSATEMSALMLWNTLKSEFQIFQSGPVVTGIQL